MSELELRKIKLLSGFMGMDASMKPLLTDLLDGEMPLEERTKSPIYSSLTPEGQVGVKGEPSSPM